MTAGRVPAMINFTAGATNILAACKAAQIDTILTSRVFVEKGRLTNLVAAIEKEVKIVYLEDIRASITPRRQAPRPAQRQAAAGGAQARRLGRDPVHLRLGRHAERASCCPTATCWPMPRRRAARIDFGREDKVFNVLPVFHSFGLTVGVVLPLVSGVRIYLYPSPLHYRIVPELIYGVNATIMFGTDTFLAGYARVGAPLRLPLAALHPGRRRAGQGNDPPDLHGEVRAAHSRRLRRHRDRAGARAEHADVQQVRHRRPHPARHGGAAREGRRASRRAAACSCADRT